MAQIKYTVTGTFGPFMVLLKQNDINGVTVGRTLVQPEDSGVEQTFDNVLVGIYVVVVYDTSNGFDISNPLSITTTTTTTTTTTLAPTTTTTTTTLPPTTTTTTTTLPPTTTTTTTTTTTLPPLPSYLVEGSLSSFSASWTWNASFNDADKTRIINLSHSNPSQSGTLQNSGNGTVVGIAQKTNNGGIAQDVGNVNFLIDGGVVYTHHFIMGDNVSNISYVFSGLSGGETLTINIFEG